MQDKYTPLKIVDIESDKQIITLKTDCYNQKEECVLDEEAKVLFDKREKM